MKKILCFTFLTFVYIQQSGAQAVICDDYIEPELQTKKSFLQQNNIGKLAIERREKVGRNKKNYYVFHKTGCYDLSDDQGLSFPLRMHLNSIGEPGKRSYVAGAFMHKEYASLRARSGGLLGPFVVNYYRNNSMWHRLLTEFLPNDRATSLEGEYFLKKRMPEVGGSSDNDGLSEHSYKTYAELASDSGNVDGSLVRWHALIAEPSENEQDRAFRVLEDTKEYIQSIFPSINIEASLDKPVILNGKIVQYKESKSPSLSKNMFLNRKEACLYFNYRINGDSKLPITTPRDGLPFFVIRTDSDANC